MTKKIDNDDFFVFNEICYSQHSDDKTHWL
jgi:hypothetical protein